ncbi:MAG: nitroreductase family protein [Prevotella sp.]|nr:nitroreductase family protein [Prevotella sp.]MCM1075190.1 nitroreductase family protein [Ruminococcus sp.]
MNTDFSYFKNRRTVRTFKPEVPSAELIHEVLELAMRAPTTGNMQLYSVVISRDPARLEKLRPAHFCQPASMAPVLITVFADVHRFEHWCKVSNAVPEFRNLQGLTAAVLDASLLAQQITTVAEMKGLGTCWLGTTTYNALEIAEALKLPQGVVPIGTLAIGYPDGEPAQCERLPLQAWAYEEEYPDFTNEEIKQMYAAKDNFPDNRKFVEENGKQTLAQVFTDVRYPAATSNPFSEKFRDYLLAAGFRL